MSEAEPKPREAEPGPEPTTKRAALFVDLDGSLVATDTLWEAFFAVLKRQPWVVFFAPFWLLRGRAALKAAIASRGGPEARTLPYRQDVLEYLRERKGRGDVIVLATAADQRWADAVASELDLFDAVLASDGVHNLKGARKLDAIQRYCQEHDLERWGYVGDAAADLPIWARAHEILVVAPSSGLLGRVRDHGEPARVFARRTGLLRPLIKAIRPHQWSKNALLFVPLMLAWQISDLTKLTAAVAGFFAFSLCGSSGYVVNDLLDIEADRAHPRKRNRPFAAGTLPLALGPPLALACVGTGFAIAAAFVPLPFLGVLALYMVVTNAYSAVLKSKLLIDVLILASLYTLRVFAGGVATELPVSEWLLAFSIFMFTSLAFAKRYIEMTRLAREGKTMAKGRGYQVADLSLIESVGPTSGYLAVLVFALYINSAGLAPYYTNKWLLWLTCPLMLYWISRLWFLAKREELHDDPVVFAITDRASLSVGALVGLLVVLAALL